MAKERKWQRRLREKVPQYPNAELLRRTMDLAGGDDYDGDFTAEGLFEFTLLKDELDRRLERWLKAGTAPAVGQITPPPVHVRAQRKFALTE